MFKWTANNPTLAFVARNVTKSSIHALGKVYAEPFNWTKIGSRVLLSKLKFNPGTMVGRRKSGALRGSCNVPHDSAKHLSRAKRINSMRDRLEK